MAHALGQRSPRQSQRGSLRTRAMVSDTAVTWELERRQQLFIHNHSTIVHISTHTLHPRS